MSQNVPKNGLTRNQKKAVGCLIEFLTIGEAAEATGVNRRTLYRWLDDPVFKQALIQAESDRLDTITRRLLTLGTAAVDALESILNNPDQDGASNKRLAAGEILGQLTRLRELRNIEIRLSQLEANNDRQH